MITTTPRRQQKFTQQKYATKLLFSIQENIASAFDETFT